LLVVLDTTVPVLVPKYPNETEDTPPPRMKETEHTCPTTQTDGDVCTEAMDLGSTTSNELEVADVDPSVNTTV